MGNAYGHPYDGSSVVFSVDDVVYKLPSARARRSFVREVAAIESLSPLPPECGMVSAQITPVTSSMLRKVPLTLKRQLWSKCMVGTAAITMPRLTGQTALDWHVARRLNAAVVARRLAGFLNALAAANLFHTDVKLENIQCTDAGDMVLLDWGSLCGATDIPTFTYCVTGHFGTPAVAQSINVICTLLELFERVVPQTHEFSPREHGVYRDRVLTRVTEPATRSVFANLLLPDAFFPELQAA